MSLPDPPSGLPEPGSSAPPARKPEAAADTWSALRRHTPARIALGRIGASLPTGEVLAFSMAHARARDAVHLPLDSDALALSLEAAGFRTVQVRSLAAGRSEYLRRPDLGRRLHPQAHAVLALEQPAPPHRLALVVADGLSSLAATRHALPLLLALRAELHPEGRSAPSLPGWEPDTIVIASEARVALADQIGALRGAEAVVLLIGERPGLSSPDSLGIYLTYAPHPGRSDAERNCLSNVREQGLSYAEAAYKLHWLLNQARLAGKSGVAIKDHSDWLGRSSLPAPADQRLRL